MTILPEGMMEMILPIVGIAICILGGGLAAGLTLGLMSLDKVGLELIIAHGEIKEAGYAKKIAPLRERGNLLLVTLLLTNTVFNEVLPLLIDQIPHVSKIVAYIVPTIIVVIFSEIIPQSLCARHGLAIGARFAWLVRGLQILFFPIAYPLSWVLDKLLGQELGTIYTRKELKGLIDLHSRNKYGVLTDDETTILKGVLDFSSKRVVDAMTPMDKVSMLDVNEHYNKERMEQLVSLGYSRIPLYNTDRNNIACVLLVKNLLSVNTEKNLTLKEIVAMKEMKVRAPVYFSPEVKLDVALNEFQKGKSHLAVVRDASGMNLGVITLEDIIEELIQEEIYDEGDIHEEMLVNTPRIIGRRNSLTVTHLRGTDMAVVCAPLNVTQHLRSISQSQLQQIQKQQLMFLKSDSSRNTAPTTTPPVHTIPSYCTPQRGSTPKISRTSKPSSRPGSIAMDPIVEEDAEPQKLYPQCNQENIEIIVDNLKDNLHGVKHYGTFNTGNVGTGRNSGGIQQHDYKVHNKCIVATNGNPVIVLQSEPSKNPP